MTPLSLRGRERSALTKQSPIVQEIASSECFANLLAMTESFKDELYMRKKYDK